MRIRSCESVLRAMDDRVMIFARRTFLRRSAHAVGSGVLVSHVLAAKRFEHAAERSRTPVHTWNVLQTPEMQTLAKRAVDAALAAGATYADARLTRTLTQDLTGAWSGGARLMDPGDPNDLLTYVPSLGTQQVIMAIGVRAFTHGYWGFAASPYWTADEAAQLGTEAAQQASTNASVGAPRSADLGPAPSVREGQWTMPGIDPFSVPIDEKLDFLQTLTDLVAQSDRRLHAEFGWSGYGENGVPSLFLRCWREERVFCSSEGASYTQVRYRTLPLGAHIALVVGYGLFDDDSGTATWELKSRWGRGWESIRDVPWATVIPQLIERARAERPDPLTAQRRNASPVDVGLYDVIFGAAPTAQLLANTIGLATELDRALGYEANASGTSYLGPDPLALLGTPVAAEAVTITADRTIPGSMAMTMWDDEGIPAQRFPLVQDGILVDYQTNREQAQALAPWYAKQGRPAQSRGCASGTTALDFPITMRPDMTLSPGRSAVTVSDMVRDTQRGIYIRSASINVDMQAKNGIVMWNPMEPPIEIRNGKLGAPLTYLGISFNSLGLWKNVIALGGAETAQSMIVSERKGQPAQDAMSEVSAAPMLVKQLPCFDLRKRQ